MANKCNKRQLLAIPASYENKHRPSKSGRPLCACSNASSFSAAIFSLALFHRAAKFFSLFLLTTEFPPLPVCSCLLSRLRGCCCWLVGCLTSQQHASVSQGRICSGNFMCCHTEIEVADQTFSLSHPVTVTDTGPTSPSADRITPGAWQGSHWSAYFCVTGMTRPRKNPGASGIRTPGSYALETDALPLGQRGGLLDGKVRVKQISSLPDKPPFIKHTYGDSRVLMT